MGMFDWFKALFSAKPKAGREENLWMDDEVQGASQSVYKSTEPDQDLHQVEKTPILEKAKDFVEGTVEEVKEQGGRLWDEVKEKASQLDDATKEYREQIVQKAKEAVEKVDDFVDQTVQKAKAQELKDKEIDLDGDGIADTPVDFGNSQDNQSKTFFDKAEKWLERNESANPRSQDEESSESKPREIHPVELPDDPKN